MKMSSVQIRNHTVYSVNAKLSKPISDATHTLNEISFLVLRLQLDNGVVGESYLLSFQYSPQAIRGALADILPIVNGYQVSETGKVNKAIDEASEYFGNHG